MSAMADAHREFPFSAEQFRLISERIYRFSGIRLPEGKREMVYARLARRLRSLGIGSFDDYLRFLELEPAEWEHCTNALTTNVTAFYREEHHFVTLAEHAPGHRECRAVPIRVWSAGCSTGRGAVHHRDVPHGGAGPGANFEVLASDLDTQVIAHAREARLPAAVRARNCPTSARSASSCAGQGATKAWRACARSSPTTWSSCA